MKLRLLCCMIACAIALPAASHSQAVIDVLHYRATISFNLAAERLDGTAEVTVRNTGAQPLTAVPLDLRDLTATGVTIGGTTATFRQAADSLVIELPSPLPPLDSLTAAIVYGGRATDEGGASAWGGCFWNFNATTFVMGVGFRAPYVSMMRHWMPSHDIPSDKATFDLTFTVPAGQVVAGTGTLASVTTAGQTVSYRWVEGHPTATYLVTYAIAPYAVVRDTSNGIPLEYYVLRADSSRAVRHFSTVPGMLDAFIAAFGPYPYDKVGYCATPIGSMEHQTMISYAQSLLNDPFATDDAAHELSHQWWGDFVTPQDFREAWLSEGFARYSEAIYEEFTRGKDAYYANIRRVGATYRNTDIVYEGAFPLYDFPRAAPSSNYPYTIYDKGGAVLAMLRHVMGDEKFFHGLRAYASAYAYGNATTEQLRAVMEHEYGAPLDWFFQEWVYAAGYPTYVVTRLVDAGLPALRLRIQQTQDQGRYPLFRMPLDAAVIKKTGDTLFITIEMQAVESQDFEFPAIQADEVSSIVIDPLSVVLKQISYRTTDVPRIPAPADEGLLLGPGYPDPFSITRHDAMTVGFSLREASHLTMDVFDTLGRNVDLFTDQYYEPGLHELRRDIRSLRPGMYLIVAHTPQYTDTRPFLVLP